MVDTRQWGTINLSATESSLWSNFQEIIWKASVTQITLHDPGEVSERLTREDQVSASAEVPTMDRNMKKKRFYKEYKL